MKWVVYRADSKARRFRFYRLSSAITSLLLSMLIQPVNAQSVVEDSSLSTRVTSSGPDFTIQDGTRAGSNLFHSFSEFSVPINGSATFDNAVDVSNIISRVTGSSISDINGVITVNGLANLFLLNPNGIILGPNAKLSINSSFIGSTAESITFSDDTILSTQLTAQPPLLTISAPRGLQLGASSGGIVLTGGPHLRERSPVDSALSVLSASNLSAAPGRTLALLGNEVSLLGGRISTVGGRIEIGSVASGEIQLSTAGAGYGFDYTRVGEFADIGISQAIVDGINPGGGTIQLRGENVSVLDGAELYIQNQAPIASSGGITINAAQQFRLGGKSPITNVGSTVSVESLAGPSGDINVFAQSIEFLGGTGIESIAGLFPGGNVTVRATDSILLASESAASGDTTGIDTLSYGPDYAPSPAGSLTVEAGELIMRDGATIASLAYRSGDSGNVSVSARSIWLDGVTPVQLRPTVITSGTFSEGNAGDVQVTTERLRITSGGRIDSSTAAAGDAGSVTISASESITVSDRVEGSINPSLIISSANLLDDALKIAFNLPPFPTGDAGDLTINTPLLSVLEGAQVTVRNDGTGQGGTLRINADEVRLQDAGITASTESGGGGNINLTSTGPLLLREGSVLSAEAGGAGDGGNITLTTPFLIALENSDIIANAFEGDGGKIEISTQSLIGTTFREALTAESDITASSQFGVSGTVILSNLEVDPSSGTVTLPENVADPSNQITAGCADTRQSQFIASGRGGLAPSPNHHVNFDRLWRDTRNFSALNHQLSVENPVVSRHIEEARTPLETPVEAANWTVDSAGDIVLHADPAVAALAPTKTASCLTDRIAVVSE